jgi:hypothetical protein
MEFPTAAASPSASPSAKPGVEPPAAALVTPSPSPVLPTPVPNPSPSSSPSHSPPKAVIYSGGEHGLDVDRVEDNIIYFKSDSGKAPKPLKTNLSDITYFGMIHSEKGTPYFIFSARPCQKCNDDKEIVFLRPDTGFDTRFEYPGKVIDQKSGAAVLISRAFFGRCIPHTDEAYVVFQQERVDKRHHVVSQSSVFVAEADEDHLDERLMERHLPRVNDALQAVRQKKCKEISGSDRRMAKRPPDLNFRHRDEADDSDEADEDSDDQDSAKDAPANGAPQDVRGAVPVSN